MRTSRLWAVCRCDSPVVVSGLAPRARTVAISVLLLALLSGASVFASDVLRVGTSGDYPPFSRGGAGFDVEVARRFAADLDLEVVWVPFRWPELAAAVEMGVFDVAMSGVTWRPERAVVGWMSRAVAAGGPCIVGATGPRRLAVNRGGILERFARERFPEAELVTVDDNLALPGLLAREEVEAFVTDSFEVVHFRERPWPVRCLPAVDRKVYWVAPQRAGELGPRLDGWIASHEAELDELRRQYFGRADSREGVDHVVDLLARRLAFMPLVAAWKREHGRPLVDAAREEQVLEHAAVRAREAGLEAAPVRALFELQIALATAVQGRKPAASASLDLASQIRPALLRLGERIVDSLAACAPLDSASLTDSRFDPLAALLTPQEIARLRTALLAVRKVDPRISAGGHVAR